MDEGQGGVCGDEDEPNQEGDEMDEDEMDEDEMQVFLQLNFFFLNRILFFLFCTPRKSESLKSRTRRLLLKFTIILYYLFGLFEYFVTI